MIERAATLDRWRALATTPKTLSFPRLELIGRDHAPTIIAGRGEVNMPTPAVFEFEFTGMPYDSAYALAELNRYRENPYDSLARPRLIGDDENGTSWNCGYVEPSVHTSTTGWRIRGRAAALSAIDASAAVPAVGPPNFSFRYGSAIL
jgi:hypothetical protein